MAGADAFITFLIFMHTVLVHTEVLTPRYFNLASKKKITATATCGDEGPELYCKLVGANADHDEHVIQGQVCDICDATNEAKKHPPEYAVDSSETWWQSPPLSRGMKDCERYFGKESLQPITRDDSVICSTEYSKIVPLEGGEYFYSIKDISIGGRCMCNGHADTCEPADPATNTNILECVCQHNTCGPQCAECCPGFEQKKWRISQHWDRFACEPCNCDLHYSTGNCEEETGRCECRVEFNPPNCDSCAYGYFDYPNCKPCTCNLNGTDGQQCTPVDGLCPCKYNYAGKSCEICADGYYSPECKNCECNSVGSVSPVCDKDSGNCTCKSKYSGRTCNQCEAGYFNYPTCKPCNCDISGSIGSTCDDNGQCNCKPNFDGTKCDKCKEQYYNYPACEECNCDPRGVIASFAGCGSVPAGELCQCKDRVQGRICNDCKPLFWNLQEYNPFGCEDCNCHLAGTLGGLGTCNTRSGQCTCKMNVGDRQCGQCQDGFYRLDSNNVFGCTECDCDIGGSIDNNCDKTTGQCRCHSRVEGRRCDRPIRAHYFPTLHQFQYEVEEGYTQSGPVRYRNSDEVFPNYSWKGYVVFSMLQNEVTNRVMIPKSSLYRMVLKFNVALRPTIQPQLVTVAGEKGIAPSPFVMNPGNWMITIKTTKEIMIDYFVLIPEAYYEATVLTKLVDKPCVIGDKKLCRHFAYPSLFGRPTADVTGLSTSVSGYIDDVEQLNELQASADSIPILTNDEIQYNMKIDPPGAYILIIEYVTPINRSLESSNEIEANNGSYSFVPRGPITVRFQSGDQPETNAIVNLNNCPYTAACRQAVVDDLSKIQTFNIHDANNVIYLMGDRDTLVGIKSIVAVPESEWHLDYITPRPYCLRRNGKCEPADFSAAVDSKKVEAESGTGGDRDIRPPTLDNATAVVFLTPEVDPLKIEGKILVPGDYMFIVHYYQPVHPESTIDVVLKSDAQQFDTTLQVQHCPSRTGCRSLLKLADGNNRFPISDNFTITFLGNKSKGLWIDYVLIVAAPDFVDAALTEANVIDYTREFIEKCANNHYYVPSNETGFCRDAMFSITAEYNSGALACFCDFMGSTELECNTFGGQCPCKPNVIGRSCSACRTGYYGFPNCMCICPKNVEGENCDRCKPYTFNFDVQRGCDDCNCNPLGVIGNQLQCEADSGNCPCRDNVIGRTCDHCVPGHYAFPECVPCTCDREGTTDDVCDQSTAQCYCKRYVTGQACDTCVEEYFNLQSSNPDGCTKCYCFGKTTRCTSSYLSWAGIDGMSDWYLVNVEANRTLNIFPRGNPISVNESVITADLIGDDSGQKVVYLVHNSVEQPPSKVSWMHSVRLSEDEFSNTDGTPVTREQFMNTIVNVTSIYIRATYWNQSIETSLIAVTLDVGVDGYDEYSKRASSVEECQCPKAYRGLSCEQCAEGYYRLSSGFCVPCQCNGHSRECDVNTGVCLECTDNTMGDHCEQCIPGYHGDASGGTPRDCLICACPLPYASNNFAIGCDLRENGSLISCQCKPGYGGARCEFCAAGYYGVPEQIGDYCKPCNCSGNINVNDPSSCDSITGDCLNCSKGVTGKHCDQCAAGYWNYTKEGCDHCNCNTGYSLGFTCNATGQCECLPGVVGEKCDRCPESSIDKDLSAINLIMFDTQDKADSFFTTQRLNYIANQTQTLRPRVGELRNVDVAEVTTAVKTLENSAKNLLRSAEFAATDSDKQITRAADLAADADKMLASVRDSSEKAKAQVKHVSDLATGLELSQQPKVDSALAEARQIREDINAKDLTPKKQQAESAFANATMQVERMNFFVLPVNEQAQKFHVLVNDTRDLKSKLDEMLQYTDLAQHTADTAEKLNAKNRQSKFGNKVTSVTKLNTAAMKDLIDAGYDIGNGTFHNLVAGTIVQNSTRALENIGTTNQNMVDRLADLEKDLPDLRNLTQVARQHTDMLRFRADNLRALAERENNNSRTQHAYTAASAYSSIVQEIGDAKKAADEAEEGVKNITQVVQYTISNQHCFSSLRTPPPFSLADEVAKADQVNSTVKSTLDIMSQVGAQLAASKEFAQSLPKLADEAQKMAANVDNLVKDIDKLNPEITQTYQTVKVRQDDLEDRRKEADEKLRKLKELIEQDDFMVVGVENGYPYLKMDIGDSAESGREPARIGSDKFVADNRWYQVIVDRVGRNVKLSIRESLDNGSADYIHSKDAVLPGQHTIFNLDRQKSKLYVGGAPSDAKLQSVSFPAFEGQIEELMIGDTPVGLWNFERAENLKGARQRDKLLPPHTGPQEYRFNGRAHVTMPGRGYLTPQKNQILLFFRTYAPDGLIYLVGEGAYFFSVQMQDGRVFLQVSLGNPEDLLIIGTTNSYNDGKWHRLDAARILTKYSLKVDREIIKMDSAGTEDSITALDTMNFGGDNKGIIQVTSAGFDGCMRQISIDGVNIDLSDNLESIGIAYGCQFASLVSLSGKDSFLRYMDITSDNLQLTLKFKTSSPDGLLFVYVSRTQTTAMPDSISLSLIKGKLVLMSQREQLDTGLSTYNDSQWHVVTVTHNNNALRLVVDDYDYFSNSSTTFGRCGTTTTTGGLSPEEAVLHNEVLPVPVAEDTTPAPQTSTTSTTTTTTTTTTRRPPPKPEQGCALAYDHFYTTGDPDVGYRFGTRNDSRIEYSKLPGRHLQGFDLTISFRTFDQHGGLVFYAAADRDPTQFLAFYMKDARLHFAFNCGGETAHISSTQTYNDTEWHVVTLTRSGGHGKLAVDSELVGETSAICGAPATLAAPFYYGGLRDLNQNILNNLQGFYQPFKGCLKGLMMNGQHVTDVSYRVNSLRCSDNVEDGVYFGASTNMQSNYLKLLEYFKVGDEVSISMEIRPRNSTGLLLSVHGKKDYLVLELLENEVVANVENGNGPFRASYSLGNKFALCDGNWHKIHVVKSLYVVSVGVDGHFSKPGMGAYSSTDTRSALYIGGHERPLHKLRGVRSRRGFTGCIRKIVIGETPLKIPLTAAGRNTHVGVCPVD
ncbi:hypothetical protein HF086_000612 [Spodoptera exigua]|uniref:Laminin subunit alpha n=1 Tax=Spodoptera exigua TaxID=7107 RepID=A0A922SEF2_SPOEX|nr:hypothetical protein HF086_000612 [Spodoptera exigua]